jgi:hypothetical protein
VAGSTCQMESRELWSEKGIKVAIVPLLVSPVTSRSATRPATRETSTSEGGRYGREMVDPILPTACDFHDKCRDLLHAANLRHGTDGFTSPPKEGMLKTFSTEKFDGFSRV